MEGSNKSWLEVEMERDNNNNKYAEKSYQKEENRIMVLDELVKLGFEHLNRIPQGKPGHPSFERKQLFIEKYNLRIICTVGNDVKVLAMDTNNDNPRILFEYKINKLCNDIKNNIEEFKFLLRNTVEQYLYWRSKKNNPDCCINRDYRYTLHDLDYIIVKHNLNYLRYFLDD